MKTKQIFALLLFLLIFSTNLYPQAIIANHTKAKLEPIPASAVELAKTNLHIAYFHTSHGSQLITGMNGLMQDGLDNLVGYKSDIYNWSAGGTNGTLDIDDYYGDYGDLGHNGSTAWVTYTRNYLDNAAHSDVNVIIWSWCGGVSDNDEDGINTYLNAMNQLEIDYPDVKFVYMTGHLDGTGETGNLHIRNEQIRNYCAQNNKILYDFADIESYDPDGNYYLDIGADDGCNYNGGNWAEEWRASHTQNTDWYNCEAAHSDALNGNLKAYAAWWLWARLAGWSEGASVSITASTQLTELNLNEASLTVQLEDETFVDNSLSSSNFQLNNAPTGTTIESVQYVNEHEATINLAFDGTDFDDNINNFSITILAAELFGNEELTSNNLPIEAEIEGVPSVEISTSPALTEANLDDAVIALKLSYETFADNILSVSNFQLNNVPDGTTIESVQYTNDHQATINLAFNGTNFDDDIDNFSITVLASELSGSENLTSNNLSIDATNEDEPYATLTPEIELRENNLNGAVVNITLTNESFGSNCTLADYFELCDAPAGTEIDNVECNSDTEVTITLSFDGTDFDEDYSTFCIRVTTDAIVGRAALLTNKITIYADLENSISTIKGNKDLKVYPNPINQFVTIAYNSTSENRLKVELIDLTGKKIMTKEYSGGNLKREETINVSELRNGNYYIVVNQGNKRAVMPVIKE